MSYSSLVSLVLSSRPSLWILHSITFRTISFGKKKARRPLNKPVIRFSATCVTGNSLIMRTRHPSIRVRHLTMKWSLNKIIFRLRLNRRHDQALAACVRNQYFVWTKTRRPTQFFSNSLLRWALYKSLFTDTIGTVPVPWAGHFEC